MARNYNVQDAYDIVNAMLDNIQGISDTLEVVDTSTFIDAGEAILSAPREDTLNALGLVIGRTLVAVRPYNAKLGIFNSFENGVFANRMRKISFYSTDAIYDGASNTQFHTNFADGFDNGKNGTDVDSPTGFVSAGSMWEQNFKHPLEINFGGSSEFQTSITLPEDALERAFRSESDFLEFWNGMLTDKANDVEQMKESFNYALLDNVIGATYGMNNGKQVVNLTKKYNDLFAPSGVTYTTKDLLTTYFVEFLEFFVSEIRKTSDLLTHRTAVYHQPLTQTFNGVDQSILRHTPKDKQRMIMFNPLWIDAEARVYPEIFNERYLKIENFEAVDFWQNFNDPSAIDVIPSYPDYIDIDETPEEVNLTYVVGMIYDADAIMTDFQLDRVTVSPLEAKRFYRNMFYTIRRNYIFDASENIVIFIMEDEEGEG